MAEKNQVTEVKALTALMEFARANGFEDEEVLKKGEHMIEVRSRKHESKKDDSKRQANLALGEQFAELWTGETFKAADVAQTLGVKTAKASAVCKAMEWEKVPSVEKVAVYKL